jgi:HSP20 family protein
MLLTRFHPHLLNEWNRLVEDFSQRARPILAVSFPPVNLWEDKDNLYAEAELPGLTHDDIEVFVEGDQLTLRGERKPAEQEGRWHRQERGYGKFERTFTLPVQVNADQVQARLEQGVLTLTLPKSEAARPRKIAVKAE